MSTLPCPVGQSLCLARQLGRQGEGPVQYESLYGHRSTGVRLNYDSHLGRTCVCAALAAVTAHPLGTHKSCDAVKKLCCSLLFALRNVWCMLLSILFSVDKCCRACVATWLERVAWRADTLNSLSKLAHCMGTPAYEHVNTWIFVHVSLTRDTRVSVALSSFLASTPSSLMTSCLSR